MLILRSSQILDQQDVNQLRAKTKFGISHTYRNTSIASRFQEAIRRQGNTFEIHSYYTAQLM